MPELKFSRADLAKNTGLALQQESVTYRGFLSEKAINVGMMAAQTVAESGQILTLAEVEQMEKFLDKENYYASLWWYSLWMVQSREPAVFRRMIDYILAQREHFSANTLFFLYYYLVSKKFVIPEIKFSDTFESLMALKDEVLARFAAEIGETAPLPYRERNKNLVVILTGQLLGEKHAPTTHALSYVAALQDMGYETEIINTAECLSDMGAVPVFEVVRGEYITGLIGRRLVKWRNRQVVCTQCEPTMPNTPTIKEILAYLRQRKPLLVISIDSGDVTGHFVNKMLPVLAVSMGSNLPLSRVAYSAVMRSHGLTDDDRAFLRWLGKDESSVIAYPQSMLVINDVESEVSRVELKIAADAFVLTVVGNRLDLELDPAFLQMLQNTLTDKIHILFIGDFDYEEKLANYPRLKEQSQSLGFRNDLLSVLKIADCFVNPRRSGGGTGGKMALVAGIPVVTLPQCDVANSAGEDFLVRDYDEMQAVITRLASDGEYYRRQAVNAKKRAATLQNVSDTIKYFIAEVLRRERER